MRKKSKPENTMYEILYIMSILSKKDLKILYMAIHVPFMIFVAPLVNSYFCITLSRICVYLF